MTQSLHGDEADLIIRGGRIHTLDPSDAIIGALAVRDGVIIARGDDAEFLDTRAVIELDGRTVVPGINDAHVHALAAGVSLPPLSLDVAYPAVTSIADIVRLVGDASR